MNKVLVVALLMGVINSGAVASACDNINPETLKKVYFDTVAKDIEALGLLCLSKQSAVRGCSDFDKEIFSERWSSFVSSSSLGVMSVVKRERYSDVTICTFRVRQVLSVSRKPQHPSGTHPVVNFTVDYYTASPVKFRSERIKVNREDWYRRNVEDQFSLNDYDQEWVTAPLYSSLEYFRRFLLIDRLDREPKLSSFSAGFNKTIDSYISEDRWERIFNEYYRRNYQN